MLLLVDECFPKSFMRALEKRGHDVTWATIVCRSAIDEVVLAKATSEGRVVVTEDRDFGTLIYRDGLTAVGVVVVHASEYPDGINESAEQIADQIDLLRDNLSGFLTTILPDRVRQRLLSFHSRTRTRMDETGVACVAVGAEVGSVLVLSARY